MRKLIVLFSGVLLLFVMFLMIFDSLEDKVEIEKPETPDIEYFTDQQMKLIIVELNKMV